ncbi:MAG: AAA family ATPase [Bacteroidales bacterium]|nr:AAA family ATPase [Bacteroidales bacterium]
MQLRHLYLKHYRNLNEFRIDFNKPISVIIGKNGSGKTNILEAIIEIFRNLFYTESLPVPFPYTIEYIIGINKIFISTLNGTYKIKRDNQAVELTEIQKIIKTWVYKKMPEKLEGILPDNIFLYYSGLSTRIFYHFSKIEDDYQSALKNGFDMGFKPLFLFHPIHFKFILLGLFASKLDDIKKFLNEKFGIVALDSFNIHLKRPDWSTGSKAKPEYFWNAQKIVFEYLSQIKMVSTDEVKLSNDKLVLRFSTADKLEQLVNLPIIGYESNLVKLLDSLYTAGFIEDLDIKFRINNGETLISSEKLSEGEQQLIAIKGMIELLRGQETLFLLDEPDNYLHPSWQENLLEDLSVYVKNANFLITTHSPQLLSNANPGISEVQIIEDGEIVKITPKFYGRDISTILYELMGVERRNKKVTKELSNLFTLVDNEDLENAKLEYQRLSDLLGEDDPAIVRAKTQLNYLEEANNEANK